MAKNKKEYKYWSKKAHAFDAATSHVVGKATQQATRLWIENQFKETDEVLELGCGTGHFSSVVAGRVRRLTATDRSIEMLGLVKRRLDPLRNATVQMEDCFHTSFSDGVFDAVILGNVIHILGRPMDVLNESRRVLKPGGSIVLVDSTSHGMALRSKLAMVIRYLKKSGIPPKENRVVSPLEVAGLLEKSGFLVEESRLIKKETNVVCLRGRRDKHEPSGSGLGDNRPEG